MSITKSIILLNDKEVPCIKSMTHVYSKTNEVYINIPQYNDDKDILKVYLNNKLLVEDKDYNISLDKTKIIKTNGYWNENNTGITFRFVLINHIDIPPIGDGDGTVADGSVNINKLDANLKDKVNKIDTIETKTNTLTSQLDETKNNMRESIYSVDTSLTSSKNCKNTKPLVTFIDDDGRIECYTKLFPIFKEKGEVFVSCIIDSMIGKSNSCSDLQIKEMMEYGVEIASHSVNHSQLPHALDEIGDSYFKLNTRGYNVENLVYPGGAYSDEAMRESRKYYNCSVIVGGGVNSSPIRTHGLMRTAFCNVLSDKLDVFNGITCDNSLDSYKAFVDYAEANNGWLVFMGHSFYQEFDTTQQQYLRELIDYIKSKNIEITTLKEGLKIFSNPIDCGDTASRSTDPHFIVGKNGVVQSSYLKEEFNKTYSVERIKLTSSSGFNASLGIDWYPKDKMQVADLAYGSYGLPESAGTLVTYRFETYSTFQYFYPYNKDNIIYYRRWNRTDNVWGIFYSIYLTNSETIREEINIVGKTMSANEVYKVEIPLSTTTKNKLNINKTVITGTPRSGIEQGIIYTLQIESDKRAYITFYNLKTTSFTLSDRTWHFKIDI